MVECEYLLSFHLMCMAVGFNRYMVECEYGLLSAGATDDDVLIDTWWNVNTDFYLQAQQMTMF